MKRRAKLNGRAPPSLAALVTIKHFPFKGNVLVAINILNYGGVYEI